MARKKSLVERVVELGQRTSEQELAMCIDILRTQQSARFGMVKKVRKAKAPVQAKANGAAAEAAL